MLLEETE